MQSPQGDKPKNKRSAPEDKKKPKPSTDGGNVKPGFVKSDQPGPSQAPQGDKPKNKRSAPEDKNKPRPSTDGGQRQQSADDAIVMAWPVTCDRPFPCLTHQLFITANKPPSLAH